MPLTTRLLTPLGLLRLESDQWLGSNPKPGQIVASSVAYFATAQDAQAALAAAGKALMDDVRNYTTISPELHMATVSQHFATQNG